MQPRGSGLWLAGLMALACTGCGPGAAGPPNPPVVPAPSSVVQQPIILTLAPFADSFANVVESRFGPDSGWLSEHFERTPSGYRLAETVDAGRGSHRTAEVFFDSALVVDSVRVQGRLSGRVIDYDVSYSGRSVTGWFTATQSDSSRRLPIETVLPDSAFDASAIMAVLPTLQWHVGMKHVLFEFNPENATTQTVLLAVQGEEQVTVPAGTFDTFRAELTLPGVIRHMWYTRSVPHRCIKVVSVTNHWHTELVH